MNKTALRQAWERLHRAKAALDSIRTARSIHHIASAWSDFLSACSAVYNKLEKGAKGHPKSEPWFGRVKNARRTDPLLCYVHHARNSDEHGIADVVKKTQGSFAIKGDVHIERLETDSHGNVRIGKITGLNASRPPELLVVPATVTLLPVFDDRFNDTFPVPDSHLGQRLESGSLLEVAERAFQYMEGLLKEAGGLAEATES